MSTSPRFHRLPAAAAAIAMLVGLPLSAARAATATTTFSVTATVATNCAITANNLNFGAYTGAQLDGTTTLQATCSQGIPYDVGLSKGSSPLATVQSHRLGGSGPEDMTYQLFQNAARTTVWGDTIGTDTVAGTGNGAQQTLTVYGRIPASQFVAPGQYSDTVTVTLTF